MKALNRTTKMLIAGAAAVASVISVTGTASASSTTGLRRGQVLNVNDSIVAYTGSDIWYQLTMQGDGNLVEYRFSGDPASGTQHRGVCWASNTYGSGTHNHALYQSDGNFVIYTPAGYPIWASNTVGVGGSTVDISTYGVVSVGIKAITGYC